MQHSSPVRAATLATGLALSLVSGMLSGLVSAVGVPVLDASAHAAPPPKSPPPLVYKIPFGQEMVLGGAKGGYSYRILINEPNMKGFRARRTAASASKLPRPVNRYGNGKSGAGAGAGTITEQQKPVDVAKINKHPADRAWVRFSWLAPQRAGRQSAGSAGQGTDGGSTASAKPILTYEFPLYKPQDTRPLIHDEDNPSYPVSIQPGLVLMWLHTSAQGRRKIAHIKIAQDVNLKPCRSRVRLPRATDVRLPLGPLPPTEIDVQQSKKVMKLAGSVYPGSPVFLNIMEEEAHRCYAGINAALYPQDNVVLYGVGEIILRTLTVNVVPEGLLGAAQGAADLQLLPPRM